MITMIVPVGPPWSEPFCRGAGTKEWDFAGRAALGVAEGTAAREKAAAARRRHGSEDLDLW